MRVLAVGNANVDHLLYVDEPPEVGGRVEAWRYERRPGGAASNFAVAAARLGASPAVVCCVGDDWEGAWLLGELRGSGVDVSYAVRVSAPTGAAFVIVDRTGERTMVVHRGANSLLERAIRELELPEADWVHAASVGPGVAARAFEAAKRAGARTSYDPGGAAVKLGLEGLRAALELTDVLFLNEAESSALAERGGGPGLERVRELVPVVVVKRGPRGSAAYVGGEAFSAGAFEVEVVDTTGAGDVFDAAFAVASWRGLGWAEALTFANACAALKVSRRGAWASPTLAEVVEFLRSRGLASLAGRLLASESFNPSSARG